MKSKDGCAGTSRAEGQARRRVAGIPPSLALAVVVLLAIVGAVVGLGAANGVAATAEAQAAPGADAPRDIDTVFPGAATPEQTKEALESGTGQKIATPGADEGVAAELPHEDLGRDEALELVEGVFPEELESLGGGIYEELEPSRYLDNHTAIVPADALPEPGGYELGGQARPADPGLQTLVESTLPLRTEDADGEVQPVDLSLEHTEDELQPENALTEVGLPTQLEEGISMPGAGVTVELPGTQGERSASEVEGDFAFYPNVAEDTDLLAAPVPSGLEMMTQIRGADAPLSQAYRLSIPAGAALEAGGGGARVVQGERTLVAIPPPSATDASGAPVPVSLSVASDEVTITVAPDEGTVYPVLVDPAFLNEEWNWYGRHDAITPSWSPYQSPSNSYRTSTTRFGTSEEGLAMISGFPGSAPSGNVATWSHTVPRYYEEVTPGRPAPTSWIRSLYIEGIYFRTWNDPSQYPVLITGLVRPGAGWAYQRNRYGTEGDIASPTTPIQILNESEIAGAVTQPKAATDVKIAQTSLVTFQEESPGAKTRDAYYRNAVVVVADEEAPTIKNMTIPAGWIDATAPPIGYEFEDKGLGIYTALVAATGTPIVTTKFGCTGSTANACPRVASSAESGRPALTFNPAAMPTGLDQVAVTAIDPTYATGHVTTKTATVKVDHLAPEVSVSGTLTEGATLGDRLPEYKLRYSATDGNASVAQSGVAKTEVTVDGKAVETKAPGCTTQNCAISGEWTLDASQYSYGKHTVEVVATDALGHRSTPKVIQIELLPEQTPPVAAYSLDEGAGAVAHDASGGAHEGALSAEGVSWAPGRFGSSLKFDGAKGCVTIPDSPALRLREEFTLEAWVRPEGELFHDPAVYKEGEGFPSYALGIGMATAGKAEGRIGTQSKAATVVASTASLEANAWQHEAVTFDGAKLRLYVGGVLVATREVTEPNSGSAGLLQLGCDKGHGSYFRGRIDEVRVYDRALEAGEVGVDRATPIQTPRAGPVAAYPLDEEAGTVARDVAGGHDGALSAEGVSWAPSGGRYGGALQLDGSKGCVTVPDSPALRLGEEFTLEAWVRPEGTLLHDPAITKQAEGFPAYGLGIGMSVLGQPEGQIGTEAKGHSDVSSSSLMEAGVWQQEALVFDGTRLRLYVEGALAKEATVEKTNSAALGALKIGCSEGQYFRGRIDEVRIYNRALEAGEVAADRSAQIQTPKQGPVAAYPLDEDTGTKARDVAGAHDGALSAEGAKWLPTGGRFGGALQLDGSKGCVTIPDSGTLRLGEAFTLESWVRPEGELAHLPIIYKAGEGFPSYDLGIGLDTAGRGEGQIGTTGKGHADVATPAAMEAGVWQHLAVTWDGARLRAYLNGALTATQAVSTPNAGGPGSLSIGCSPISGYRFRGRIDEVRIYNRALEAAEVSADAEAPIQAPKKGPVAAYSFDEGSGTSVQDVTGDGHTAAISGATWATHGRYGGALDFSDFEGCVQAPDSPELRGSEQFTLEAWVRPTSFHEFMPVFYKQRGEGYAYGLWVDQAADGKPMGEIDDGAYAHPTVEATAALPLDVWSHLALTFDGARIRLYIGGKLVDTAASKEPLENVGPLEIGCAKDYGYEDFFEGRIDEARVYNRALSETEIVADKEAPLQAAKRGPVAAYPLDEGEGTVAHDATGGAHEGALSAEGVSWAPGRYGTALRFDGAKGCVTVPDSEALRLGEAFTLEAWVRPEGELAGLPAIVKQAEKFPAYALGIGMTTTGKLEGQIGTEAKGHSDVSAASPAAGAWSHEALTYDGAALRLFVEGHLVATKAVEKTSSAALGALRIGCSETQHFRGRIDDVRVYDRALEEGELEADRTTPLQAPQASTPPGGTVGPSLVASFSFDEAAAPGHDSVENGPTGTPSTEGLESKPGRYGSALKLDGAKGCLTVPDSAALQLGEEFTLEAWVRPEGELARLPILWKEGGGFPAYALGIGLVTPGKGEGQIGTTSKSRFSAASPASMQANVWQHLTTTFDGAKLRLYLDGELVATKAVSGTNSGAAGGALSIGCGGGSFFRGRIDEVRIYNRALGAGEVGVDREAPIQTPRQGPVAAYAFDEPEAATTASDSTGGEHNGTLSSEGVKFTPAGGRYGGALQLDGAKGCVTIPDSEALRLGEEFTLEAWVRPEGELTHLPIAYKAAEGFPAYDLGIGLATAGKGEGQIGTASKSSFTAASQASMEANVWQHLATTFDGSKLRLYLDGALVATKAVSATNSAATGSLTIGCGGGNYFRGRIDELRVYSRALTVSEVGADREAPIQTSKTGPVAAYAFDEPEGATTAADSSGNQHTGTLSTGGGAYFTPKGRYGGALQLNGTNGCVTLAKPETLALGESFTLEAWIRPEGELTHLPILYKDGGSFPAYDLGIGLVTAGKGEAQIGATSKPRFGAATPASLEASAWQHLAATFDGSKLRLYLNGELVTTKAVSGSSSGAASGALTIGCGGGQYFHGRIDELRIYNRALGAGEIGIDRESPQQATKTGPLLSFPFDEPEKTTTAADSSGNNHTGTLSTGGGVYFTPLGRYGGALQFNGTNGCLTVAEPETLALGEEFTLEAWVRPEGELTHLPILYKAAEGFPSYDLGIGLASSGKGEAQIGTTSKSSFTATSPASMEANVWQHLAATFDDSKLRLYLDGALVATKAVSGTESGAKGALTIGCGGGQYFHGRIDELRVYNRALGAEEVGADRESALQASSKQGPVASFPLDEPEGAATAVDSSGNAHTGTLSTGGGVYFTPKGRYGGALQFNGTNGCVTLTEPKTLGLGEEFTLEAWVRPEGELTHLPILYKTAEGFPAYDLGIGLTIPGKGEAQLGAAGGSRLAAASSAVTEANVWQRLAATYDGSKLRLYLNAEPVAAKVITGRAAGAETGAVTIGCGGGSYFNGRIDELRIYARALSAGEVTDITPPSAPENFELLPAGVEETEEEIETAEAGDVIWKPSTDGSSGAGVEGYSFSYSREGGPWTDWQRSGSPNFSLSNVSAGEKVEIKAYATDRVGNRSATGRAIVEMHEVSDSWIANIPSLHIETFYRDPCGIKGETKFLIRYHCAFPNEPEPQFHYWRTFFEENREEPPVYLYLAVADKAEEEKGFPSYIGGEGCAGFCIDSLFKIFQYGSFFGGVPKPKPNIPAMGWNPARPCDPCAEHRLKMSVFTERTKVSPSSAPTKSKSVQSAKLAEAHTALPPGNDNVPASAVDELEGIAARILAPRVRAGGGEVEAPTPISSNSTGNIGLVPTTEGVCLIADPQNRQPVGVCNPTEHVKEEGLAVSIPEGRKMRLYGFAPKWSQSLTFVTDNGRELRPNVNAQGGYTMVVPSDITEALNETKTGRLSHVQVTG